MSERLACTFITADGQMVRYQSRRPPDIKLRSRLHDLADQRRRFGYRRMFILPRERGEPSGINRSYRFYREEGLTVRSAQGSGKRLPPDGRGYWNGACCNRSCPGSSSSAKRIYPA